MIRLGHIDLDINDVRGEAIAVLGMRGTGKSNSTAVIVEDVIGDIPFTIIDPQGEYYGLKEQFDILIAGCGPQVEMVVDPDQAAALAEFVYSNNLSVILDLSGYEKKQRDVFLVTYLRKLWRLAGQLRRLHFILIEEARQFIPQTDRSELRDLLTDYATMGRKWGLGMIIVNQRSSNISKDVLSQAGILLLHQVAHSADLSIYKDLIPGMSGKEVEATVRGLQRGQAVFVRGARAEVISIRERSTFHAGSTPDLAAPTMRQVDKKLLEELQALLSPSAAAAPPEPTVPDSMAAEKIAALRIADANAIAELRRENTDLKVLVDNLREEIKGKNQSIAALSARVYAPDLVAKQAASTPLAKASGVSVVLAGATSTQPVGTAVFIQSEGILHQAEAAMQEAAQKRQQRMDELAIERQKNDLISLCQQIRDVEKKDRFLLASVLERPGQWVHPEAVAVRFSYSKDRYRKNPPYTLIEMKLVEKGSEKETKKTIYRLSSALRERYSSLAMEDVTSRIFTACGVSR